MLGNGTGTAAAERMTGHFEPIRSKLFGDEDHQSRRTAMGDRDYWSVVFCPWKDSIFTGPSLA